MRPIGVGCSPERRWLARYAEVFDTVEVKYDVLPAALGGHGARVGGAGRRRSGSYSATEFDAWARELSGSRGGFAYFNNDWEGFAVRNALGMRERLGG
ncbi:MAG: DUF72 domain-containing protein [Solirubrobacteraceae bacterium]